MPDDLVRESLTRFALAQVGKLQKQIIVLAVQLCSDLRQCAADLGISDSPGENEFQSVVRGTPVFELPNFRISLSRPGAARLFGQKAAEQAVAKQISRQLPQSFHAAIEAYWNLVKAWSASVIGQLSNKFESYAENYRAQAEVALNQRVVTSEELAGIAESLASLKADMVASNQPHSAD